MKRADEVAAGVNLRLREAAESGAPLELILVLRGTVQAVAGGRWRIRIPGRPAVTFPAGAVVAATAIAGPREVAAADEEAEGTSR